MDVLLKAIAIWLGLLVIAVLNGALRELLLKPVAGEHVAHLASTIILCAAIIIVALFTSSWVGMKAAHDAFLVGLLWVVLTVAFEFLAGHYLFGNSWETLLADYNVFQGRVWLLVLLTNLLAPLLAFYGKIS
jgi:hypothetical protein